jgi:hypothetical protein
VRELKEFKTQTSLEKDYQMKTDEIVSPPLLGLPAKSFSNNAVD